MGRVPLCRLHPLRDSAFALLVLVRPAFCIQLARPDTDSSYWPTHGWRRSSPEAQGMDSGVLADAFDYIREHHVSIHSLVVVRNGYVVLDAVFWPFHRGETHDLASVTKSVTSTLVGIAIAEHRLTGVREPMLAAFGRPSVAHPSEAKEAVTLEHLLTMTSGLDCHFAHGEITLSQMMASPNWVRFMLDRGMVAEPGRHYEYCSPGMHLLSAAVARAAATSTLAFARRTLFGPLGITEVAWPADPQGVQHGWGDLHLRPLDMAKLGYLWLEHGRWEHRQIVPADWIRAATSVATAFGSIPAGRPRNSRRWAAVGSVSVSFQSGIWWSCSRVVRSSRATSEASSAAP